MPATEPHILDIARVIQLAVAPVFLLTAIGTFLNVLAGRLARAVDRRRHLDELLAGFEGGARDQALDEVRHLSVRIQLTLWSMALAVLAALLVCLLIGIAFIGAFIETDLSRPVAMLFVASVFALTVGLVLFLREVFVAAVSVQHMVQPQPVRVDRT